MNPVTGEWVPGVFSEIWRKCNAKSKKNIDWIQCDGPVDAIWIENLNTVLDDNRILTLANADRIPMSDMTKMTFEVENLNNASPATVSRCGIIYVSETDLYWEPLFKTWTADRAQERKASNNSEAEWIDELIEKYFKNPMFGKDKTASVFTEIAKKYVMVMDAQAVIRVTQLLNLFTGCLDRYDATNPCDKQLFEKYFVYCYTWALGGLFETEDRAKFHKDVIEKIAGSLLPNITGSKTGLVETMFDYWVNPETKTWELWQPESWEPPKRLIFSQLLIPTTDSTRAEYIVTKIAKLPTDRNVIRKETGLKNTLLVGGVGTAKTSTIIMYSSKFNLEEQAFKRINFSSATLPINYQDAIENELEKNSGKNYRPIGNKKMSVFIDDMSMPFVNAWGDQITLEIVRQLITQHGFYFLDKENRGLFRSVSQLQFLGAMNHPGGGRNNIPNRLKRLFFNINMTPPSVRSIENIYGRILTLLFQGGGKKGPSYSPEVVGMRANLVDATIALWEAVAKRLLPSPSKFHYNFNIRELARVFGGIARVAQDPSNNVIKNCTRLKEKTSSTHFMIGLWRHECDRTFVDKLINSQDKKVFTDILNKITKEKFRDTYNLDDDELMTDFLFADFQREDVYDEYGELQEEAPFVYEAVPSLNAIRKVVNIKLEAYNEKNPSKKMNLVIFDDALFHLLRICRIINTPSGNGLLVGVGGSGKQSLTKLSSFICKQVFFQISLTKSYGLNNLKDDIKALYSVCGPEAKSATFILTDAEIKDEIFLEAINSMLATGEIPGLFQKEDRELIPFQVKPVQAKEAGNPKGYEPTLSELWAFFINRVKDHLHMVLAFSPVGAKFRTRAQKFPSIFSTCNIDWFLPWPKEALISVSSKFLDNYEIDCSKEIKSEVMTHMGQVHNMVTEVCDIYFAKMRRYVYVTPKSYLSFIAMYQDVYRKKYDEIDLDEINIRKGLDRLAEATIGVEELKIVLKKEDIKLKEKQDATDKLIKEIEIENRKASIKQTEVNKTTESCVAKKNQIEIDRAEADKDLQAAMPYLNQAANAVKSIKQPDIVELKKTLKAADTTKLIFDAINLLFMQPLEPITYKEFSVNKEMLPFINDSFEHTSKNLQGDFLKALIDFSDTQKDNINEETIELLEPYLNLACSADPQPKVFSAELAAKSSKALVGLSTWARAMSDYHKASKIVKPKLRLLQIKDGELQEAERALAKSQAELDEVKALQARLDETYNASMAEKTAL